MTDLKLTRNDDGTYGDLEWINGELSTVTGEDEILQAAWIALKTGLGEWPFDTSFGFPYEQILGERGVDTVMIEGAVRQTLEPILGADGVQAVEITHDAQTKVLTIKVDSVYGEIEAST